MNNLDMQRIPKGLRLQEMRDGQDVYTLAFSEGHSDYESWIAHCGCPDINARLLISILGGSGTLVDVGANIGTITIPVALNGSSVIAIEMIPANVLKLWVSAEANGLKNIHIVQAAASDRDGILNYGGQEAGGFVTADPGGIPALCLRLDTILSRYGDMSAPLLLKIDVEGHEAEVLRGASGMIEKFRPIVLFESIEIEGAGNARRSKEFFEEAAYDLFLLKGNILCPKATNDVQEGHVCDFLAVPHERRSLLHIADFEIRPFTDDESLDWIREMASFPMPQHQRHAAMVLLRWQREKTGLVGRAGPIISDLIALDHLSDIHGELRRLV